MLQQLNWTLALPLNPLIAPRTARSVRSDVTGLQLLFHGFSLNNFFSIFFGFLFITLLCLLERASAYFLELVSHRNGVTALPKPLGGLVADAIGGGGGGHGMGAESSLSVNAVGAGAAHGAAAAGGVMWGAVWVKSGAWAVNLGLKYF
ncbi:hypothetical protein BDK51DRAFT_34532, partial [Blyttiomyces helicus]